MQIRSTYPGPPRATARAAHIAGATLIKMVVLALSLMLGACASLPRGAASERLTDEYTRDRGIEAVAPSQEPARPEGALELDEAVQLALKHNPRMREIYAALGIADAGRVLESAWAGPGVSLAALRPEGGGSTELTLGVAVGLGELLLLPLQRELAAHEHAAMRAELAGEILELAAEVEQAWFALVSANLQLEVTELEFEAATLRAELAQRFVDAGNLEELALRREQSALSHARLQLLEQTAERKAAWRELAALLGADPQARWYVHARLPWLQQDALDLDTLRTEALATRLDIEAQRHAFARMNRQAQVSGRMAWLGGLEFEAEHEREGDERHNGLAFELGLPIPAIVGARRHAAEQTVTQGQAQLAQLQSRVDLEVRDAFAELELHAERARELRGTLLPLRTREVELALLETNFMLLGVWDLMAEQQALFEDYRATFGALGDYWQARVALGLALGRRLAAPDPESGILDLDTLMDELGQKPATDSHQGHDMSGADEHSAHAPQAAAQGEQP